KAASRIPPVIAPQASLSRCHRKARCRSQRIFLPMSGSPSSYGGAITGHGTWRERSESEVASGGCSSTAFGAGTSSDPSLLKLGHDFPHTNRVLEPSRIHKRRVLVE